jgi:hypothetical protein
MSKSSKCLNVKAYNLPGGARSVLAANREYHCATTGFMLPKVLRRNTIRGVDAMTVTDSGRIGRNRPVRVRSSDPLKKRVDLALGCHQGGC